MSETNKVEAILTEIKESLEVEKTVSETLAKNADSLVEAQVEKFDALAKSVELLSEKLDSIHSVIAALNIPSQEEIEKAIELKAEEINKSVDAKTEEIEELSKKVEELENEPVVKSATVVVAEEITEEVVATPLNRQDMIRKAVAELNTADYNRKAQLFKAISRLEAGVDIDKVNF
jgi:hypothetical protein